MKKYQFETVVENNYRGLYAFGLSLTRNPDEALELAQEAFSRFAQEGHNIRDVAKIKSWLFATLYHVFAGWKRRERNLPHFELSTVEEELPCLTSDFVESVDAGIVKTALYSLEERFRAPLVLYYLEENSYLEIAEILDIPVGTVMSRLSRAKTLIRSALSIRVSEPAARKVLSIAHADADEK